jgi:pimeloyl-ACP methyl ester carboxylesterase
MVDATLDTIARALPAAIRADYLGAYAGDRLFESLRYVQRYTRELPILARLLPQILNPVQIIAGEYDRFVPASNGVFLAERLPNSQLVTVDAGHFVWEDAPDRYASLVANWATGSYQTLRGRR